MDTIGGHTPQWKDADGDGEAAAPNPAGRIDLTMAHGGRAAESVGFMTVGCCDNTKGSWQMCSALCTYGVC